MNAIQLLKDDHILVRQLLTDLSETTNRATKRRADLLDRIALEIKVHATLEEEIFYPAFRKAAQKSEDKMYFEALEEHTAVEDLIIPHLKATETGSDKFGGRAKVLKELVEHHIKEEEGEMFKRARQLLSTQDLKALGERMMARKQELLAQKDTLWGEVSQAAHTLTHSVIGVASAGKREARAEELATRH